MPGEALPILVGVTGKRDLAGRDEAVRRALTALFDALERAFPASPKVLVTGLAEGSDMLATEVALARPHWRVAGLLAFAEPDFIARFTGGDAARATFTRVTAHPRLRKITLAPLADSQPAGPSRGDSYEQLGLWLARNTAILIGVMPADEAEDRLGGTARVLGHRCRGTVDEPAMAVQHRSLEVAAPLPLDPPEPQPACILDLAGAADARGALPVLLRTLDSTATQRDTPLALVSCAAPPARCCACVAARAPCWPGRASPPRPRSRIPPRCSAGSPNSRPISRAAPIGAKASSGPCG
ncbi:MAG: hypothetical protein O9325_10005 [Roseomonas sp.]|nr:hypothetical protein [Roseomonas sp.]